MGDHRITLSIKAEFHGKTYEIKDAWWNWCGPVDRRVIEFFEEMYSDGMARYHDAIFEAETEERDRETEKREREELVRLKQKYEAVG